MKTLLDFSYTGRLKLNHSSVESILKAATLLEFTKVKKFKNNIIKSI